MLGEALHSHQDWSLTHSSLIFESPESHPLLTLYSLFAHSLLTLYAPVTHPSLTLYSLFIHPLLTHANGKSREITESGSSPILLAAYSPATHLLLTPCWKFGRRCLRGPQHASEPPAHVLAISKLLTHHRTTQISLTPSIAPLKSPFGATMRGACD